MSKRPWMPFYVGDYLKATQHLSGPEHAAYLLLMFHYWEEGVLPAEDKRLARIAKMSDREWRQSRDILASFFLPGWRHARLDEEIRKSDAISSKRRDAVNSRPDRRAKLIAIDGGAK